MQTKFWTLWNLLLPMAHSLEMWLVQYTVSQPLDAVLETL